MIGKLWRIFRDAITGRFVSKQYAKDNPKTTVSEKRRATEKNKVR